MDHRGHLVLLPPNRVWRTYTGGRTLDRLAGAAAPADGPFPEDWLASTTRAVNAGREAIAEGVSHVLVGGDRHDFATLLAADAAYFLGAAHAARHGPHPQLLVKLLDPAIRLHFQAHPSAEFARRFLGAPSGKTEAYHVLATRPEVARPHLYLGFQRPPDRAEFRRIVERQDIAALEACFDPIPVQPGDTFLVPAGVPHALGAGIFLVEIQEPSDLVARFEFERGGHVLPEPARFMGRGLDFCLEFVDWSLWPRGRIHAEARRVPLRRRALGPDSWQDDLIGPQHTPCFRVRQSQVCAPVVKREDACHVGIVTAGAATFTAPGGAPHRLGYGDRFFVPAELGPLTIEPAPTVAILECYPPAAA